MKFNDEYWQWNNGCWRQTGNYNEIRIDCFNSNEAVKCFGILTVGKIKIIDGITLGVKNQSEGSILLLKYALENHLVVN